ncbi:MAG: hypothetical protein IH899_19335 [Planctomycetes bacterium]|nr:hypothetical protein [Planctomycetota bacterium]
MTEASSVAKAAWTIITVPRFAWNRREPSEVDAAFDPHRHPALFARVADVRHRAVPAFVLRRAAVFDRPALRFVADVGHRVPHDQLAELVVAEERAGFIVDDVARTVVTGQPAFVFGPPQRTDFNQRRDVRVEQLTVRNGGEQFAPFVERQRDA